MTVEKQGRKFPNFKTKPMTIFRLYQIISVIQFIFGLCYIYLQNNHVITLYWLFGLRLANMVVMLLITGYKELEKLQENTKN